MVGIAQLTHHSVRGGGQKSLDLRFRDFCPHLEPRGELISQYLPPLSFRYKIAFIWKSVAEFSIGSDNGLFRQQSIARATFNTDICRHMSSIGHIELKPKILHTMPIAWDPFH